MIWNKKTKTIAWVSGGILLLILLIIVLSSKKKAEANTLPNEEGENKDNKPSDTEASTPPVENATKEGRVAQGKKYAPAAFPLKQGMAGKEVEQLQAYLVRKYGASFPNFGVDGIWDKETQDKVKTYLKKDTVSKDFYIKTGMNKIKTIHFV